MTGLSTRNLLYMRSLAAAWPDLTIVQQGVAQLPWGHNVALPEKLRTPETRAQGWFLKSRRRVMQYIDRLSAVFMLLAGLYLVWCGLAEIRGNGGTSSITPWSGQVQTWVQDQGAYRLVAILGVLVIGALAAVAFRKRTPTT
jgi:DUF1016 N-terminal domain